MDRPSFLVLGAGKAGTTSFYYYLAQHPDVFMSDPKEPRFFQIEYERGLEWYWRTYYREYAGQRHAGEAAHNNLRLPYVTGRIAESVPDARFFVLCRNPVERALSAYWHNVTRGREVRSFEEALQANLHRLETGPRFETEAEADLYAKALRERGHRGKTRYVSYLDSGYYAQHVERFGAAVGLERIKVLFFDDLVRDPDATMREAFAFLDLAPVPLPDTSAQNRPIAPALAELLKRLAGTAALRRVPLGWRLRAKRIVGSVFSSRKPKMAPETRGWLVEHFRPHNRRLAELTGRDLSAWDRLERDGESR